MIHSLQVEQNCSYIPETVNDSKEHDTLMIQLMAVQYQVLLLFGMVTAFEVVLSTECNMDDTVITLMIDTFICRLNKMAHIFLKFSMTANSNVAICCLILDP